MEEHWLAPLSRGARDRLTEAGQAPDGPGDYCDHCGATVGPYETDECGCSNCRGIRWPWDRFVRVGRFEHELRELVHETKFAGRWKTGRQLGRLLSEQARLGGPLPGRAAVVPVPSARLRRLVRGVDHTAEIAHGVGGGLGAPVAHALVARRRPSQVDLPPSKRVSNVRGAFRPRTGVDFAGWTALLVDDVRTSGATLAACARALVGAAHPPKAIWACVVAVTTDPAAPSTSFPHTASAFSRRATRPGDTP